MTCRICGAKAYSDYCFRHKPRSPIKTKTSLKQRGKYTNKWLATRKEWLRQNPQSFFFCYICHVMLPRDGVMLDHIKSRARHPELRYELTNLAPICPPCNKAKGSIELEEFLEKLHAKEAP